MVEKFKRILSIITKDRGMVNLLALLKMDEFTDKWTVILSAPWAKEGDIESFKYFLKTMNTELLPEEASTITRIGIFSSNEHLIELLLRYNNGTHISNEKINGNQIHEGFIIESNKTNINSNYSSASNQ